MTGYVLFQMWEPFRQSLIDGHLFYVAQARKRLLAQFDDIEAEADKAAEEWLSGHGSHFDPDSHDPGDFYEAANDAGIEFYQLLTEMRDRTRLSVVAGMFHEWDKQLRNFLVHEIQHWHHGRSTGQKVWAVDFVQLTDLLESFGWPLRGTDFFKQLDACRLVVNVYKHGAGKSLDELKQKYPEYLHDPFLGSGGAFSEPRHRDHSHLNVSDSQLQAFADAIVAFWRDFPKEVAESQSMAVPEWFEKAILKDRAAQHQAGAA
jgi:hypothetical protein